MTLLAAVKIVLVKDLSLFTNRTWRKLQRVMRNWLQTTGSDADTEERESIIQELNEVLYVIKKKNLFCHLFCLRNDNNYTSNLTVIQTSLQSF